MVRELRPEEINQPFLSIGAANDIGDPPAARIDGPINLVLRRLPGCSENSAVLVLRLSLWFFLAFRRFGVDGIQSLSLHGMRRKLTPVRQNQRGELHFRFAKGSEIAV